MELLAMVKILIFLVFILVALSVADEYPEGSSVIQIADDKSIPGVWKKKTMWKARWVQEWKQEKIWKPYWKKVWGPVQIQEWVPIARPPPHWMPDKGNGI